MSLHTIYYLIISFLAVQKCNGISSPIQPFTNYKYSAELQPNVADLWWTPNEVQQNIIFELHVKTTGWIAFGISPAGGMTGADIGLGWIDQANELYFEDRYASTTAQPMVDNTTIDWFGLQGREQDGWTAIQFRRAFDTCDIMDVPIKSGTNVLIFAYGLDDPDMSKPQGQISYHENRRGSRVIPLRSYNNPSPEQKFADLDYFEFQLNNYVIPANDTTYYCKVYKVPANITERRHAIAHKMLIEETNRDIVHHLLMYECDPTAVFDDNNLPDGLCDYMTTIGACVSNIATAWAVGGDQIVEFPEVAGYPVGGDSETKYYMVQMHYNNQNLTANRRDSSGMRFYLGKERRQYDLGYLTFGVGSNFLGLAIPPKADKFIVDTYCTANTSYNFPQSGITVFEAFPHTHLQGQSVWTKIIRNKTAVDYLFNAEAYSFNYQFQNTLPKPVQLYPGDEFATRCIYNTANKNEITLGGESTKQEMCLHIFGYYPRVSRINLCMTFMSQDAWMNAMNASGSAFNYTAIQDWLLQLKWTPESIEKWQEFYNDASRILFSGASSNFTAEDLPRLPKYQDLEPPKCRKGIPNSAVHQNSVVFLTLVTFITTIIRSFL